MDSTLHYTSVDNPCFRGGRETSSHISSFRIDYEFIKEIKAL